MLYTIGCKDGRISYAYSLEDAKKTKQTYKDCGCSRVYIKRKAN